MPTRARYKTLVKRPILTVELIKFIICLSELCLFLVIFILQVEIIYSKKKKLTLSMLVKKGFKNAGISCDRLR